MITETTGDLLRDDAQALVNAVNTAGVMGKGIALEFKRAFPEVFTAYAEACADGRLRLGRVFPVRIGETGRWIIHFPTKAHWRARSRLDHLAAGLDDLARVLPELGVTSVAIPALGCGHGGLPWAEVRPLITEKLADLETDIRLYVPSA